MGILSTGQARQFALGGVYGVDGGDEPIDPYQAWLTRNISTEPSIVPNQQMMTTYPSGLDPNIASGYLKKQDLTQQMLNMEPTHLYGQQGPGYERMSMQMLGIPSIDVNNLDIVRKPSTALSQPSAGVLFPPQQGPWESNPSMLSIPSTSVAENKTFPLDESRNTSFGNDYNAYLADAKKYQGKYRDAQSVDDAFTRGDITQQERDRLQLLSPEQLKAETKPLSDDQNIDMNAVKGMDAMRYMNPIGQDFGTNMFQLGRSIKAAKGTPGKGLGIIANAGAGAVDLLRNLSSGMAYENMNDQTQNYYEDLMKRRQYTNASQTQNANITGGVSSYKEGGLFQNQHFALGGEQQPSEEEQMMMQQQAQQQQGESQGQPEEQEAPAPEQIMQVAQQLVEGLKSLEAIDAYLKEQGVDQETYAAIMQAAQQILEGGAPQEEAPTMRGGGTFKHKVGDKIEFTHKGKKHRGTIKKIENGQIYL